MPKVNLINASRKRQEEFVKSGETVKHKPVNTANHIDSNTGNKKKATFNMEEALHHRLKLAAVNQKRDMTEIMEKAVTEYLDRLGA